MKKFALVFVAMCCLVAAGFAQSFSSFHDVTSITGITITPQVGTSDFTVTLEPGATMTYNGVDYGISQIIGVFALSAPGSTISATEGSAPSGWTFVVKNVDGGGIAGYEGNANGDRINVGESGTFSFASLSGNTSVGFHLQFTTDTPFGQTAFVTAPVPEPASMVALGFAGLAFLRRKRKSA